MKHDIKIITPPVVQPEDTVKVTLELTRREAEFLRDLFGGFNAFTSAKHASLNGEYGHEDGALTGSLFRALAEALGQRRVPGPNFLYRG